MDSVQPYASAKPIVGTTAERTAALGDIRMANDLPASSLVFRRILDRVGYGVLVVDEDLQVLYANSAGKHALGSRCDLSQGYLLPPLAQDRAALMRAITRARSGLRTLLEFRTPDSTLVLACMPLNASGTTRGANQVLVLLGRQDRADPAILQLFAIEHSLTDAESRVLLLLCDGTRPSDIANKLGVALCTVRTHLQTIRAKTRTQSLIELTRRVATLPPMANALVAGGHALDEAVSM